MPHIAPDAPDRAKRVRLALFDVDGVLTDGRLWYGPDGEMFKAFHTLDGHGIKLLGRAGIQTAILSGRRSAAVAHRAGELGIGHVHQGIDDKRPVFDALTRRLGLEPEQVAYMGDDVMDLGVLRLCGFASAPAQAHPRVLQSVHFVPAAAAGRGAARETCEFILASQGLLERMLETP